MRILIFSFLLALSASLPGPKETMIRYQCRGIVGRTDTNDTLTINSVPIAWSDRPNNGFLSVDSDSFHMTLKMIARSFNHSTSNHTYQRTRECLLEGLTVRRVSDRIHYDSAEYLSLNSAANTWTAAVPQARALQQQWDRDNGRTERHKIDLQNGCTELFKAFSHSNSNSVSGASLAGLLLLAFVIAAFLGQFMVTFFISRHCSKHTGGGVLGSIVHYHGRSKGITSCKGDPVDRDSTFTGSKGDKSSLLVAPA